MPQLNGFVVLHRSLLKWGWHSDPATGWLFINLILLASHTPTEWKGIKLDRGQLITGRKSLAAQTGLSEQSIRTALNHLKSTGEITIESTNKYSLITIVNYRKFQDMPKEPTSTSTSTSASSQPATNHIVTNKQDKQDNIYVADAPVTKKTKRFIPPDVEEVAAYCREIGSSVDPHYFVNYYESNGWKVGRNQMKSWRAALKNWTQKESGGQGVRTAVFAPRGLTPIPDPEEYAEGLDASGFGWA